MHEKCTIYIHQYILPLLHGYTGYMTVCNFIRFGIAMINLVISHEFNYLCMPDELVSLAGQW